MSVRNEWDAIQDVIFQRRSHDAPLIRRMVETKNFYNGDVIIPLIDADGSPNMEVLMPHLVAEGIDGNAMRAAGPMPTIHVPALNQLKEKGIRSQEYAAIRRRVMYARWHESRLPLILGRAYRQLVGYGTFGMVVVPNFDSGGARIEFRDALGAYPALRAPEDVREPENVGFVYGKSPEWIRRAYPAAGEIVGDWQKTNPTEELWDLVEWIDEGHVVIGLLGPRSLYASDAGGGGSPFSGMELKRWENKSEMVPAIVPRRVTLDRIAGQMEKIIPMEQWAAKLMALDMVAAERYVFPDLVVLADENRTPQLINGSWRDGRTGQPNLLQNVRAVQQLQGAPGPMTQQSMDRLERNARISGGVSPFLGGETTGSLRTGRAIDALGGFAIDPRIAELQTIMQYGLETINKAVCAVEKGYFTEQHYTVFSGWPSDRGQVEYTPGIHFETHVNTVSYPFPGTDVSEVTVAIAQLAGANLMSRRTARDKHPFIEDAEMEERLVVQEGVEDATLAAWAQKISQGEVSMSAVAHFFQLLHGGMLWPDAIFATEAAEQERQAQQAAAMQQAQANPALGMGAAAQPGLGGGPAPVAAIPPPQQGLVNVAAMSRALAAGQR